MFYQDKTRGVNKLITPIYILLSLLTLVFIYLFLSEKYNLNILVELLFLMLVANAVASFAL